MNVSIALYMYDSCPAMICMIPLSAVNVSLTSERCEGNMTCCFDNFDIVSSSMFCRCDFRSRIMMSAVLVNVDWGSLGRMVDAARPDGVW